MPATPRPNILLICVDDMNPWMSSLSDLPFCRPAAITPNLDRLAARGVTFTHAFGAAPLCNPARTALMTGLHPTRSGVYENYCWWRPHLANVPTLPEIARANGYAAHGAGKVYHHCIGFNPPEQWNDYRDQRFDDHWDRQNRVNYPHIEPCAPPAGHPFHGLDYFVHEFDWGSLPIGEEDYGDQHAVDYAIKALDTPSDQPFLLACGLFHPHLPWYAPKRFFDLYDRAHLEQAVGGAEPDWEKIPAKGRQLAAKGPQDKDQLGALKRADRVTDALHAYLANISFADEMIGRVLRALERSPHADNTMVVFCGDHGFHVGTKNHFGKMTLWRESTHVPLIFAGPGVARGQRVAEAVSTVDIAATLAELCGWQTTREWDSQSLVPFLQGRVDASHPPVLCSLDEHNHAVVTRDYRYICYEDQSEELYDLRNDPLELHNIRDTGGADEIVRALRQAIPRSPAPSAPGLAAYDFDWKTYQWQRR